MRRNDRMTSNWKMWIENGAPDKGDLEEDYRSDSILYAEGRKVIPEQEWNAEEGKGLI